MGKTSSGWFFGLKLHLVTDTNVNLVSLMLTSGNIHDANPHIVHTLVRSLKGKIVRDKGYLGLIWGTF